MNEKASRHTKEQPKEKKIPKSSTKKRTSMFTAVQQSNFPMPRLTAQTSKYTKVMENKTYKTTRVRCDKELDYTPHLGLMNVHR